MKKKIAICLFGHLRTFKHTAKKLNELADLLDADIFISTWSSIDNHNSYHGENMQVKNTNKFIDDIYGTYPRLKLIAIDEQEEHMNSIEFNGQFGSKGIVGHQYHMWMSVKKSMSLAIEYQKKNNNNYTHVICTRPDVMFKSYFERFESIGDGYNFGFKKAINNLNKNKIELKTVYDVFFITNFTLIDVINSLLITIKETNGKILSNDNYFLDFLSLKKYKVFPLQYFYDEEFYIKRNHSTPKRLYHFLKTSVKNLELSIVSKKVSNFRIRFFILSRQLGLLRSLKYNLLGLPMTISTRSLYSFEYFKYHDPIIKKELSAFAHVSKNAQRFLDVGALHGIFSFAFTNASDKIGFAVDPSPLAYPILEENILLNPENKIKCFQLAFSDKDSQIRMKYNWQHLEATHDESEDDLIIQAKKMDDFLNENEFEPDLIKIDVEGYEYFVLKGGENYLSRNKPTIFLELHHEMNLKHGTSTNQILSFLKSLNYKILNLEFEEFDSNLHYLDGIDRVICIGKNN